VSALNDFMAKLTGPDAAKYRTPLVAVGALAVGVVVYFAFLAEPAAPTLPKDAVLPKRRPPVVAQATTPAPSAAGAAAKPGPAASKSAPAPAKPAPVAAKGADAAKTVAVPSTKPAPVPPKPAPSSTTPAPAKAVAAGPAPAAVPTSATPAVPGPKADAPPSRPVAVTPEPASVTIQREVFSYDPGRRRDPFVSLAKPSELGPLLGELKLIGIAFDEGSGRNSVAVLRDGAKGLYRVKVGQSVGRAKVATIGRRSVTFNVDEFGVSRQETMTLRDTTKKGME
jgi:hypothetical protein